MLYTRTQNEIGLERLFIAPAGSEQSAPMPGNTVNLIYHSVRDCSFVLEGLEERSVAYLPIDWYDANKIAANVDGHRSSTMAEYLQSIIGSFDGKVVIPIHQSEYFALLRMGLVEPAESAATFAMLSRKGGIESAAAAFLDTVEMDYFDPGSIDEGAFEWILEQAFTIPQGREIVRVFIEARRKPTVSARLDQCRVQPNIFYNRLLRTVAAVPGETPDQTRDAERRQIENRIVDWVQTKLGALVTDWNRNGWPEAADHATPLSREAPQHSDDRVEGEVADADRSSLIRDAFAKR